MAKKMTGFKTKGMNRDLSVSAFNPEFAFENRNLRLSTNDGNTLMSWVNERGTLPLSLSSSISGTPIGTAVLNDKLVLFTTGGGDNPDHIYVLEYSNDTKTSMTVTSLYDGSLGFSTDYPIETLVSYEAKDIQKVYWTDNKNQPRVINIAVDSEERGSWNDTTFDFVNTLQLQEEVTVEKKLGASGMFAPGVIQYAFTYYHKYGQETNIFYTSPLQYISYRDRGASPEDKVENAFQIVIKGVDTNFDYIRIYSIQRTSVNATPICKRIQDIAIKGLGPVSQTDSRKKASYLDTGVSGNVIDPTELLFKGGEAVIAKTMEQKDNTLFLGNLKITRSRIEPLLSDRIHAAVGFSFTYRRFFPISITTGNYVYANQLTSYAADKNGDKRTDMTVPCGGFKVGDVYRLGVLFQHLTGKWSDPIFIDDQSIPFTQRPVFKDDELGLPPYVEVPIIHGYLSCNHDATLILNIYDAGYRKIRPVVVFPNIQDRNVICQGVVNPTVFTTKHKTIDKDLHALASWFFRPSVPINTPLINTSSGTVCPQDNGQLCYTDNGDYYNPEGEAGPKKVNNIRTVEIQGLFNTDNKFQIDQTVNTLHSPDIEFDDAIANVDFVDVHYNRAGDVVFTRTLSDIDIQTETPTVSSAGNGFVHKSFSAEGAYGIMAGLFYDDYIVDDNDEFERYKVEKSPAKWMVYPWHKSGSLNNDINRPADKGVASAVLKKKIISNLRIADTVYEGIVDTHASFANSPLLFNSDEDTIIKFGDSIYRGNIDTMLLPDKLEGMYFAYGNDPDISIKDGETATTEFTTLILRKTFAKKIEEGGTQVEGAGLWRYKSGQWQDPEIDIGTEYTDLVLQKGSVRMKYKSTPHLVISTGSAVIGNSGLAVIEVIKNSVPMRFGGDSKDALKENLWVPCGEPVVFNRTDTSIEFNYSYGDTYYQRYDCLKTYAFTPEDINQVVEIGSFMLETRINIDGRYDRNRGQQSNLYMSPQNFNLLNPVYSQVDNFFTYRIQDDDYYTHNTFPNQITWSKTKESGTEVDMWTNMTLASILELDGSNGELNSLQRFNDQLIAFQDTGISQILYNENVQVSSTDGVPIEIANSGKVQGKRYLSNTVGCTNKWSIVNTLSGIYFMDSHDKSIFLFNGQLGNLSASKGFNAWAKQNIPDTKKVWTPDEFENFTGYYDRLNQDILFINSETALAFSEKLDAFTSFYDYGDTPYFCNLENTGIWIRKNGTLWKHQANSAYCNFFGTPKPYWMTLIGNPEPLVDKIFTNLEFRATIDTDGIVSSGKFIPLLPFDTLESWNEYQHGSITLQNKSGHEDMQHDLADKTAPLKRKFRIWRCDVPRDNMDVNVATETPMGIFRKAKHPIDRMRNPWVYFKLTKDAENNMQRVEMHDLMMTYFT